MSMRNKKILAAIALIAIALPLVAGLAFADDPSADDLGQGASALLATVQNMDESFGDAVNGHQPEGADGVETEFPGADPRYVEGPAGGLAENGPLR